MQPAQQSNFLQSIFGTSIYSAVFNLAILTLLAVPVWKFIARPLLHRLLAWRQTRDSRGRQLAFLEITPPASDLRSPEATEALLASLHGVLKSGGESGHFLNRSRNASLEIVSTRDTGIRYVVVLDPTDVAHVTRLIISYLPSVRIREIDDYLNGKSRTRAQAVEFTGSAHFAFPLRAPEALTRHDPITYLTGAMTRPNMDELFAFQVVVSPATQSLSSAIRRRLLVLHKQNRAENSSVYAGHILPEVQDKLDQQLFTVSIRTLAISPDAGERLQDMQHTLYQFHRPGYQGLVPSSDRKRTSTTQAASFRFRTLSANLRPTVLSVSELAALYHFPLAESPATENLVRSLHDDLPAPLPMKQRADNKENSIVLGTNSFHGLDTPIGLTEAEREKHVYVIGGTGNGKTTLMLQTVLQDIQAGKGLAFIDPHGDAAAALLRHIPKSRRNDVIYLNPRDIAHPVGINLLELPEGLSPDEQILEQERITEAVVGILRKLFADDLANAHRIESMLRNTVRTALTVPDATLFTVLKLLRNSSFRNSVVKKLKDEDLKDFWIEEFNHAGNMQRVSMTKGLTARLDRFRASAPAYRVFSQEQSTVNFEAVINSGKILICNFSTDMGEDTAALFGTSVLALLKIAAERRIKILERDRAPYYVYVDEFQNFATMPFVKMLSSSRKYKLFLTIAEQSTAQQAEARLTEAILANVGTVVVFRTGSPADERLLLPWFKPNISEGDINNLPAYHFYIRTRAVEPIEPVSGHTVPLEGNGDDRGAHLVQVASRKRYATEYTKGPDNIPEPTVTSNQGHLVPKSDSVRKHIPKPAE